jgi:hypothetical protein
MEATRTENDRGYFIGMQTGANSGRLRFDQWGCAYPIAGPQDPDADPPAAGATATATHTMARNLLIIGGHGKVHIYILIMYGNRIY